jgi:predicted ArsR family transcriptional regulator
MNFNASTFKSLERVFHEKSRLAITAFVAESEAGVSFMELREACNLTDGNLKAHLVALEEAGVIATKKFTGKGRPRTVATLTPGGREKFAAYLGELEKALRSAARAAGVALGRAPFGGMAVARAARA